MITPDILRAAAQAFAARSDSFAAGKADTCLDLADKLDRWGSFASSKQAEFAERLVQWSKPRQTSAPTESLPKTRALVAGGLRLDLGTAKVVNFQSGAVAVVSPQFGAGTFGVIDPDGSFRRFKACPPGLPALLMDIELRGVEAVKEIGRSLGRCCVCSRTLTDESSIEAGIGPVCAQRFN